MNGSSTDSAARSSSYDACCDSVVAPSTALADTDTGVGSSGSIEEATLCPAALAVTGSAAAVPLWLAVLAAVLSKLGIPDPKPKELPGENDRSVKAARDSDEALSVGRVRGGGG